MKRYFGFLLFFEILVIVLVACIFKLVSDRLMAGAIAGAVFVLLGLFILRSGLKDRAKRSTSFWLGCIHLLASSLPLMITRLMNRSMGFEQVNVLGLPGPAFHKFSTAIYLMMMIATVWDLIRAGKAQALKDATWPRDLS